MKMHLTVFSAFTAQAQTSVGAGCEASRITGFCPIPLRYASTRRGSNAAQSPALRSFLLKTYYEKVSESPYSRDPQSTSSGSVTDWVLLASRDKPTPEMSFRAWLEARESTLFNLFPCSFLVFSTTDSAGFFTIFILPDLVITIAGRCAGIELRLISLSIFFMMVIISGKSKQKLLMQALIPGPFLN